MKKDEKQEEEEEEHKNNDIKWWGGWHNKMSGRNRKLEKKIVFSSLPVGISNYHCVQHYGSFYQLQIHDAVQRKQHGLSSDVPLKENVEMNWGTLYKGVSKILRDKVTNCKYNENIIILFMYSNIMLCINNICRSIER